MNSKSWQERVAHFAETVAKSRLHPTVLAWTENRQAASRGPWVVAFSGGADSLGLLFLLWAHWPGRRRQLVALHFNHRLRGRAADADERFCQNVCTALDLRLVIGRWRRRQQTTSEDEARGARFGFFDRAMLRLNARSLWLGHHQNDIAETLLMRLARGSGTAGLAAPRPVQRVGGRIHLRPLLTLKKEEIVAALHAAGLPWRDDQTNFGGSFFRNRIRRDVLPAWQKAAGRDAVAGAALARELLEEDDVALETWLDSLRPFTRGRSLDLAKLAGYPRALIRRALRRWISAQPLAGELSRQGFEDLLAAVVAGQSTRRSLGQKGFARIHRGVLRFECGRDPA